MISTSGGLDVGGRHRAFAADFQAHARLLAADQLQAHLLHLQHDLGDVLAHARDFGELVVHVRDAHRRDRRAG